MFKYGRIGVKAQNHGKFVKNLPAVFFESLTVPTRLCQFIENPKDIPVGLQAGIFVYNPEDQTARFVTEKEVNEFMGVKDHVLGSPVGHLQAAYESFRKEGLDSKESDPQSSKAAFEDAALVADTIGSIENGLHRGQFEKDTLDLVEAGE